MKRINKKQSGFTLLELLVVVAILAIIAGAVISAISGQEERAGQGVALNTMGALENATRQHAVLNSGLPADLDSLVCAGLANTTDTGDLTGTAELIGASSTEGGGLADGLAGKLTVVEIPAPSTSDCDDENDGACMLIGAGITSLRYAELTACDDTDDNVIAIDVDNDGSTDTTAGGDDGVSEVLANTLFWPADSGGQGASVPLAEDAEVDIAILTDPTDIGQEPGTIVGVFGVGNFSAMSTSENKIISRGPVDGNVDGNGERYSHFSIAVKVGEVSTGLNTDLNTTAIATSTSWEADEVDIVAILDSDGDNFDDEVAEFAGLEDE